MAYLGYQLIYNGREKYFQSRRENAKTFIAVKKRSKFELISRYMLEMDNKKEILFYMHI